MTLKLNLVADELAACVGCGLCLPHCPTFRATGEEKYSPRGRIAAMRGVEWDGAPVDAEFVDFMETCVQCRGCEPACPSGVRFGHLMEGTRTALADAGRITPRWQRAAYAMLRHHRLLLVGSTALAVAQRMRLVPKRMGVPRLALRRGPAPATTGTDAWLFIGCVMDAWMRDVHRDTNDVLAHCGVKTMMPIRGGECCGALHTHAGLEHQAVGLAKRVMGSMPGDAPILVNSAGCGAALKEYGKLVGTPEAAAFSSRVFDVHEYVAPLLAGVGLPLGDRAVIVQDPCHLRHVQRAHLPVRAALSAVGRVVELDDDGLCCGAGGAYSALEPELAGRIRERKLAAIARASAVAGSRTVVSANPGCLAHLAAAGVEVRHPMSVIADALRAAQ